MGTFRRWQCKHKGHLWFEFVREAGWSDMLGRMTNTWTDRQCERCGAYDGPSRA